MLFMSCLFSCDDHHEIVDTSMKVGHILCSDGTVMPYDQYRECGKTASGVVFNVSNGDDECEGKAYAVWLHDADTASFADTLGVKQNTSASISMFDGNTNTYNIYTTQAVGSPMASKVFDIWNYGQSAYIPSVAQMRLLSANLGVVNSIIGKCGGDAFNTTPSEEWHWTSTEVQGQETHKAWLFSLCNGAIQETPKDQPHKIRPIVTIY